MAEDLYALTQGDVQRLRGLLSAFDAGELNWLSRQTGRHLSAARVIFGALTSAAAATTALLGGAKSGTLNVYTLSSTGGATDTGVDETVWNLAPQTATTDRWTVCERDNMSGRWIITTQFCS